MKIPILSEEQYQALKELLHHAHDKFWKMLFMLLPVMREYIVKVLMPQLPGVSFDLDHLVLDNTSYLNPKLQPFYSDLVYLTTIVDAKGTRKPVKIALLLEHKSEMPSQLEMRIQLFQKPFPKRLLNLMPRKRCPKNTHRQFCPKQEKHKPCIFKPLLNSALFLSI